MNRTLNSSIPTFVKIFAWAVVLITVLGLVSSAVMIVLLSVLLLKNNFGANGVDFERLLWFAGFMILQTADLAIFFASSVGLLRHRKRALKPFRRCLWGFVGYMVFVSVGQLVVLAFVRPIAEPSGLAITTTPTLGFTAIVAWLSAKMFRILSTSSVIEIME